MENKRNIEMLIKSIDFNKLMVNVNASVELTEVNNSPRFKHAEINDNKQDLTLNIYKKTVEAIDHTFIKAEGVVNKDVPNSQLEKYLKDEYGLSVDIVEEEQII